MIGLSGMGSMGTLADRVLTLNIKPDIHCFGALGVDPWARTCPHVLAWRMGLAHHGMGSDDRDCVAA